MFDAVLKLTLQDQQRSDMMISYAQFIVQPIWGAFQTVYDLFLKDYTGDIDDLSNAVTIADGIYNLIPSLI